MGVCRCLEYVDEVNCPRFLFVCLLTNPSITKIEDYEETITITYNDVAAHDGFGGL